MTFNAAYVHHIREEGDMPGTLAAWGSSSWARQWAARACSLAAAWSRRAASPPDQWNTLVSLSQTGHALPPQNRLQAATPVAASLFSHHGECTYVLSQLCISVSAAKCICAGMWWCLERTSVQLALVEFSVLLKQLLQLDGRAILIFIQGLHQANPTTIHPHEISSAPM